MSKYSKSRRIAYYLTSKPKIIASLSIALLAVFILLLDEVSTDNIGHSQIMPTNSSSISNGSSNSSSLTENSTTSDLAEDKNTTSSQPSVNDNQNSSASGILSNSSLVTTSTNSTNSNDSLENATKTQNPLPQVKIISHTKGQEVPEGTLSINGVSSDDSASTCDVYVILNGIKPYQRVTPTGESGSIDGTKDYSLWKFTFLPTYGLISEGDNKMTAKITCMNGSLNATKFNSLNVTGITSTPANTTTSITRTAVPLQSSENATTTGNLDTVQGNSTSLMTTSSAPTNGQQQQAPATQSITPQAPQTPKTNYYGISPSSPLSDDTPTQNSSFIQQQDQAPANNIQSDSDQSDSIEREVSLRTKEAVDKFIERVQGTVEERFEEAIKMRTPFELVTPTPFDSEDVNDSNNNDDDVTQEADN